MKTLNMLLDELDKLYPNEMLYIDGDTVVMRDPSLLKDFSFEILSNDIILMTDLYSRDTVFGLNLKDAIKHMNVMLCDKIQKNLDLIKQLVY